MFWRATIGGLYRSGPRYRGWATPARLLRDGNGGLLINAQCHRPGTPWLEIVLVLGVCILGVVVSISTGREGIVGAITAAALHGMHTRIRRYYQLALQIDIRDTRDIVIDVNRRRMAFRSEIKGKPYWVVLAFRDDFVTALSAVYALKGPQCRRGSIGRTGARFFLLLLAMVALTVAAVVVFGILSVHAPAR